MCADPRVAGHPGILGHLFEDRFILDPAGTGTGRVPRNRCSLSTTLRFLQAHNAKSYLVLKPMNSNTCPHLLSFR